MESTNNGRAKITHSPNGTEISIPSRKNFFLLFFGAIWLGGWFFGFMSVKGAFGFSELELNEIDGFLIFWLIGWTIGGVFVLSLLLWGFLGKEILNIESSKVRLTKGVLGVGLKKVLNKSEVNNIRFNEVDTSYSRSNYAFWGIGEGKIKFDYGMRTYSVGLGLDDAEAHYLVEKLEEMIN